MRVIYKSAAATIASALAGVGFFATDSRSAFATDEAPQASQATSEETKQQTDPIAAISTLGVEDWFVPVYHGDDGRGNSVVFRANVAFDLGQWDSISRLTVPFVTSSPAGGALGADEAVGDDIPSGPTGIGDIEFYDLLVLKRKIGRFTIGPTFSFPTARNEANGSGKWEVGPAGGLTVAGPPRWHIGAFSESFFSFAGESNSRSVAKSKVQPILYYTFPRGWSLGASTMNFTYDWLAHRWTNVPLGLRVGKLIPLGEHAINTSIEGEYNFSQRANSPEWTVRLKVYYVFPNG